MQNNPQSVHGDPGELKDQNQKLLSENAQLKRDLEKELLYHNNLFKQWKELNEVTLVKDRELAQIKSGPKKGIPKVAFYSVFGIMALLAALNAYYLLFNTGDKTTVSPAPGVVMIDSLPITTIKSKEFVPALNQPVNTPPAPVRKEAIKDSARTQKVVPPQTILQDPLNEPPVPSKSATAINEKSKNPENDAAIPAKENAGQSINESATGSNGSLGLYKVRSKAYLYNNPDENSRRNAFIIQWDNADGTLTALNEKNGFIYIEFKNHLGQLSKGWVRKIDLDRIS